MEHEHRRTDVLCQLWRMVSAEGGKKTLWFVLISQIVSGATESRMENSVTCFGGTFAPWGGNHCH